MTKTEKLQQETERRFLSAQQLIKHAMEKLEKCFICDTDDCQVNKEGPIDDKRREEQDSRGIETAR